MSVTLLSPRGLKVELLYICRTVSVCLMSPELTYLAGNTFTAARVSI